MRYLIFDNEDEQRFSWLTLSTREEAEHYAKLLEEEFAEYHPNEFPCRIVEIDE